MLTSCSAFAAVFSRPERPPLSLQRWAHFPYSRNMWCLWLENLDLDLNLQQHACEIKKMVFILRNLSLYFLLPFFFQKLALKNALKNSDLARACIICRKKYKKIQIIYRISKWNSKGSPRNPYLDFLSEIHLEDEFFKVEIRFRILLQTPKSEFQKVNQNFPIEHAHSRLDTTSLKTEMRCTANITAVS